LRRIIAIVGTRSQIVYAVSIHGMTLGHSWVEWRTTFRNALDRATRMA
jgi:hypothetical protein